MKTVEIPGSKSYTNRVLILASIVGKKVKILNPLFSDDTKAMINCLKTLGIKVLEKKDSMEVTGNLAAIPHRLYNLDADLSGTTMRFMLALSTIIPGVQTLYGKEGLNKRPIKELVKALSQLGAKIEYLQKTGFPPVKVSSSKLNEGTIKIKGTVSSQYISALLMIAPLVSKVIIKVTGDQISKPYIDMTIDIMKKFGVRIFNTEYKRYVIPANQKYNINRYVVEGDVSSACYFFAIAALTKSTLKIKNINPKSVQADMKFIDILQNMGSKITYGKNEITITGNGVKPVNVDMEDCPDQIQTLAVLGAFANGITKISGTSSLRIKETNRIFALKQELKKMGISVASTKTALTIHGGNPKPATINTYEDHRMAMSFAVASSRLDGMEILNPDVVNKTFPDFWKKLKSINIKTLKSNIVLIGMRGSGKTTVAKLLAKKLNREYLELDQIIIKKTGLTIPQMVRKYGWKFFRDKESAIVKENLLENCKIISTGGGVVTRAQNLDALKSNGVLFFLNASVKTLVKRIEKNDSRPALTNHKTLEGEIAEVLNQREQIYKKAADRIINTDYLRPEQVADEIISEMRELI